MRGLPNELNKFNNTRVPMLGSIYQMTLGLLLNLSSFVTMYATLYVERHNASRKSIDH